MEMATSEFAISNMQLAVNMEKNVKIHKYKFPDQHICFSPYIISDTVLLTMSMNE